MWLRYFSTFVEVMPFGRVSGQMYLRLQAITVLATSLPFCSVSRIVDSGITSTTVVLLVLRSSLERGTSAFTSSKSVGRSACEGKVVGGEK